MQKGRKRNPGDVRIRTNVDSALHRLIKDLAQEQSVERDHPVYMGTLLNEALSDLVEKYGVVVPGEGRAETAKSADRLG